MSSFGFGTSDIFLVPLVWSGEDIAENTYKSFYNGGYTQTLQPQDNLFKLYFAKQFRKGLVFVWFGFL